MDYIFKNLKKVEKMESYWINNYWIIDHVVYFTDASFNNKKSIVASINMEDLIVNIKNKKNIEILNNPINIQNLIEHNSDLKMEFQIDGYVANMTKQNSKIVVSVIKGDDVLNYMYDNNKLKSINRKGVILNQDVYFDIITKQLTIKNDVFADVEARKSIVVGKDIIIQTNNQIFLFKNNNLIPLFEEGIYSIEKWDDTSLLVSDQNSKQTYCFNIQEQIKKGFINETNYFSRLATFENKLIIAKPFFDNQGFTNYYLPLIFIY